MENYSTAEILKSYQSMPMEAKISLTQNRIFEWYRHYSGEVCVSFSGGKDSTVLLHLVRQSFPHVPAVFSDTGLEYPEIREFVRSFDNVDIVRPKMRFDQVISTYGYPVIGKEVAEAIYYARRIRSQSLNVEREREPSGESAKNSLEGDRKQAQRVLGPQGVWKRKELGGGRTTSSRREQREAEGRYSKGDGPG